MYLFNMIQTGWKLQYSQH